LKTVLSNADLVTEGYVDLPAPWLQRGEAARVARRRRPIRRPHRLLHVAGAVSHLALEFDFRHLERMKLLERITVEPGKCGGRPCIRGLRIRVTDILGMLAEGVPHEEILRDFPYLEPDDIKAALAYAARQADHTVLQPT
jgi:uncharacterized protein (DUF433 family)